MFSNIYIALMAVHIIVSLIYLAVKYRTHKSQAVSEFAIVLLLPGFGLLLLLFLQAAKIMGIADEDPSYMYKKYLHGLLLPGGPARQEADILPIEDVLSLDDVQIKRTLLVNAIKKDILKDDLLFKAVKDPDSEVSHYAVSVVTSRIEELESVLFHFEKTLKEKPDNIEALKHYADAMGSYLRIGFLDAVTKKKNEENYVAVLERLLNLDSTGKKYFIEKINFEMILENYNKAEAFCERFIKSFPGTEEPYIMYIKLYAKLKSHDKLIGKIHELKSLPIRISNSSLEIIRFWDGGEQHV